MNLLKTFREKLMDFHPVLQPGIRVLLGSLFIGSGWEKLQRMDEFVRIALSYKVLPLQWAEVYAHALPYMEILGGAYLILGLFTRWAAGTIAGLLVSFMIAIGMVLARGEPVESCGCFVGGKVEPVTPELLGRDVVILLFTLYIIFMPLGRFSLDNVLNQPKNPDG